MDDGYRRWFFHPPYSIDHSLQDLTSRNRIPLIFLIQFLELYLSILFVDCRICIILLLLHVSASPVVRDVVVESYLLNHLLFLFSFKQVF
jgi:hypothetical protein